MVDDIDGGEASETVSFALDGVSYEIDLSGENADALRAELEHYIAASRRVGGRKSRTATSSGTSTLAQSHEYNQAVRAWAAANGYELADRGRIAADVLAGYEAHLAAPVELESAPATKPVRKRAPRKKKADATA